MKSKAQRKLGREVSLVIGVALCAAALAGCDWRMSVGFVGVMIFAGSLWGLFRGE